MYMRPNQSQFHSTTRLDPIATLYSERLTLASICKYRAANGLRNGDKFRRIFLRIQSGGTLG
jgi:hypothetical protein